MRVGMCNHPNLFWFSACSRDWTLEHSVLRLTSMSFTKNSPVIFGHYYEENGMETPEVLVYILSLAAMFLIRKAKPTLMLLCKLSFQSIIGYHVARRTSFLFSQSSRACEIEQFFDYCEIKKSELVLVCDSSCKFGHLCTCDSTWLA